MPTFTPFRYYQFYGIDSIGYWHSNSFCLLSVCKLLCLAAWSMRLSSKLLRQGQGHRGRKAWVCVLFADGLLSMFTSQSCFCFLNLVILVFWIRILCTDSEKRLLSHTERIVCQLLFGSRVTVIRSSSSSSYSFICNMTERMSLHV